MRSNTVKRRERERYRYSVHAYIYIYIYLYVIMGVTHPASTKKIACISYYCTVLYRLDVIDLLYYRPNWGQSIIKGIIKIVDGNGRLVETNN